MFSKGLETSSKFQLFRSKGEKYDQKFKILFLNEILIRNEAGALQE